MLICTNMILHNDHYTQLQCSKGLLISDLHTLASDRRNGICWKHRSIRHRCNRDEGENRVHRVRDLLLLAVEPSEQAFKLPLSAA